MEFQLNQEQQKIRDMVRDFAEKEIMPIARELEETGEFPWEIIRKMATLGLLGFTIPGEYGGAGADNISFAIAMEEIARACGSLAITLDAHTALASELIYLFGSEEQKQTYLVPMAGGKNLGAVAMTEPEAGSDAAAFKTRAVRDNGQWVINGQKIYITNGSIADVVLLTAVTNPEKGKHGLSNFILEKGTPGFLSRRDQETMGLRNSVVSELSFQDCRIPQKNLLGKEGEGLKQALTCMNGGRISVGAMAVGLARAALEKALAYSKDRVQFDQPIAKFQAVQWMLADMATEIDAARFLVYRAAWLKDSGLPVTKEAAMAKLFASETAERACCKALQIHGGLGYMKECDIERIYRDQRVCAIGEGTSEIQRLLIARHLLGKI